MKYGFLVLLIGALLSGPASGEGPTHMTEPLATAGASAVKGHGKIILTESNLEHPNGRYMFRAATDFTATVSCGNGHGSNSVTLMRKGDMGTLDCRNATGSISITGATGVLVDIIAIW